MIVLNLMCRHEHRFEGWFASAESFEDQRGSGLLSCPICDCDEVERLPAAPRIMHSRRAAHDAESLATVQDQLLEVVKSLVRDSDDVGRRFPEEARKIHYQEAPPRSIRGIASLRETRDLLDEGIVVLPLPVPPGEETH